MTTIQNMQTNAKRNVFYLLTGNQILNYFKNKIFPMKSFGKKRRRLYICSVFFMVLDLRLTMKIGCRETTFPFYISTSRNKRSICIYPTSRHE